MLFNCFCECLSKVWTNKSSLIGNLNHQKYSRLRGCSDTIGTISHLYITDYHSSLKMDCTKRNSYQRWVFFTHILAVCSSSDTSQRLVELFCGALFAKIYTLRHIFILCLRDDVVYTVFSKYYKCAIERIHANTNWKQQIRGSKKCEMKRFVRKIAKINVFLLSASLILSIFHLHVLSS